MKNIADIFLTQKAFGGKIDFRLHDQEIRMLRLLLAPDANALECWRELWYSIGEYETAANSCKELMPSAVRKVQLCTPESLWNSATTEEFNFLAGLPRYTWAKNHHAINQTKIIAGDFKKANIEVVAIKGISEIICNIMLGYMRITRDIDLLIHEQDLNKCRNILKSLGWQEQSSLSKNNGIENLVKLNAYTFYNPETKIELDLHIAVVIYLENYDEDFTENIWLTKTKTNIAGLHIPNQENRLLIAIANAFNIGNWRSGMFSKYIFDALLLIENMNSSLIENAAQTGQKLLGVDDKLRQIIALGYKVRDTKISEENNLSISNKWKYKKRSSFMTLSFGSRLLDYLLQWKLLVKSMENQNSIKNKIKVAGLISYKAMKFMFIKVPQIIYYSLISNKRKQHAAVAFERVIRWHLP